MSKVGITEVYENALSLEIDDKLTIKIASLAEIALLKFVAYSDRPHARRRDVQDI